MSWDILPKANLQYFLSKLKAIFDTKVESTEVEGSKTVTGDIVTVTDAAEAYAEEVSVAVEPQQDLHGYDKPWVGGAGKNLLSMTAISTTRNGITFTVNRDAYGNAFSIVLNGTATDLTYIELNNNVTGITQGMILNGCPAGGNYASGYSLALVVNNGSVAIDIGDGVTINSNYDTARVIIYCRQGVTVNNLVFKPMISVNGGTFEPYSNISPIQGYDIVSVDRCGKNLIGNGTQLNGFVNSGDMTFNTNSNSVGYYFKTSELPDTITMNATNGNRAYYGYFDDVPASGVICKSLNQSQQTLPNTITVNRTYKYIHLQFSYSRAVSNVQVEQGSQATTYEPYNKQNVSLQLGNKNLLPMTVEGIKAANTSGSWSGNVYTLSGVTITVLTDENGCVTGIRCNGNSSGAFAFYFFSGSHTISSNCKYNVSASKSSSNWDTTVRNGNTDIAYIDAISGVNGDVAVTDTTFTSAFVYFNASFNDDIILHPMIRDANITDSTFSPYNPTLGGMVYGGQLTLNDDGSAVFVGDKAEVVYDGSSDESWSAGTAAGYNTFYIPITHAKNITEGNISNYLTFTTTLAVGTCYMAGNNKDSLMIRRLNDSDTVSTWKTWLASNPLQVCYKLVTPFTIHLSAEQLKLLQGTNNVWSNAGDVTLKYQPDNVIAEPKADVQRLRDDVVNTIIRNEYASKNLWDMTGFLKATGWSKISDNSYTGSNVSIHYNNYSAYIQNAHDVLDRTSLYGENFTASFDLKSANSDAPSLYLGFVVTNTNGVERYIDTGNISTNRHVELTTNCSKDERVTGIYFSRAYDRTIVISNFQLERGSSPHAYEPYIPTNAELYEMIKALQS